MKKLLLASALFLFALCVPAFADSLGNPYSYYYYPWQYLTKVGTGSAIAIVTLEANANNNIWLDRVIYKTDKSGAVLQLTTFSRGAHSFATTREGVANITLNSTGEALGGQDNAVPLFIADKGKALEIQLSGTSNCSIMVAGRRGEMPLMNPSTAKGY